VIVALVTSRTVVRVNTASPTVSIRAVGTEVRMVRGRQVTHSVKVLTLRVRVADTGLVVGTGAVQVAVTSVALITVGVLLALSIIRTDLSAGGRVGPVTHGAHGVLEADVESKSPLAHTARVLIRKVLAGSAGKQTGLSLGSALPEPAAVAGVLVVVGLLGDGVHKLGAVGDHAAIIGETVDTRVVGDGVVIAVVLRRLGGNQTQGSNR